MPESFQGFEESDADALAAPLPGGFFIDANQSGSANGVKIAEIYWGRLVDLYDRQANGTTSLRHRNLVIGEDIRSDGIDFLLETNAVTEQTALTILHPSGSSKYASAFAKLDDNLGPVLPKGLGANVLPPFSLVPRNAAMVVRFDDLIDHTSVNPGTLQLLTGYPPETPVDVRLIPDPNHGDTVSGGSGPGGTSLEFRTTRVILDLTTSELESQLAGNSVPVNTLGLPASEVTGQPNVALVIPTKLDFAGGQFSLLENLSGHPLATSGNGPVDFSSASLDVVRSMRSGGGTLTTGDKNNGFLLDLSPPRVLGAQAVTVTAVAPDPTAGAGNFVVNMTFASAGCATAPRTGDVLQLSGIFAEVTKIGAPPVFGTLSDVKVKLLAGDAASFVPSLGVYLAAFDQDLGDQPGCFVTFIPTPGAAPTDQVAPGAQMYVRFSEPMDPASVTPFDTLLVSRTQANFKPDEIIVGQVFPSIDLKSFSFVPELPLAHSTGNSEEYFLNLFGGEDELSDLAGNGLDQAFPQVAFRLDSDAAQARNGGIVLRFNSDDEDGNGFPEIRGQFLLDLDRKLVKPRPVSRFPAAADRSQPLVSKMIVIVTGVQTPLSPLGSKLMHIWRYCDTGFSVTDESNFNVDVEGLNWAPLDGQVVADAYERYEIGLAHSSRFPDEALNLQTLLPLSPNSGLLDGSFDINVLDDVNAPKTIVHPRELGYVIDPANSFQNNSGTIMMPYPLNQTIPQSQFAYYTWRDTQTQLTGGLQSKGVDPEVLVQAGLAAGTGITAGANSSTADIPSIGLPLLMEHKCYPSDEGLGLNSLDISIAINSSSKPNFRVFSTGGYNSAGLPITKDPDLESVPDGGFNATTASGKPIGAPTDPDDDVYYIGQADMVVRVSRIHTVWFDAEATNPDYLDPVLEPRPSEQPAGTSLALAFRGGTNITSQGTGEPDENANDLDAYGDQPCLLGADNLHCEDPLKYGPAASKNPDIDFLVVGDQTYKHDIDEIDGARHFQTRVTFTSNAATGLTPVLSALGIAFIKED